MTTDRGTGEAERARKAKLRERAPYGYMCADPDQCVRLGYCPRDPTCGD